MLQDLNQPLLWGQVTTRLPMALKKLVLPLLEVGHWTRGTSGLIQPGNSCAMGQTAVP